VIVSSSTEAAAATADEDDDAATTAQLAVVAVTIFDADERTHSLRVDDAPAVVVVVVLLLEVAVGVLLPSEIESHPVPRRRRPTSPLRLLAFELPNRFLLPAAAVVEIVGVQACTSARGPPQQRKEVVVVTVATARTTTAAAFNKRETKRNIAFVRSFFLSQERLGNSFVAYRSQGVSIRHQPPRALVLLFDVVARSSVPPEPARRSIAVGVGGPQSADAKFCPACDCFRTSILRVATLNV